MSRFDVIIVGGGLAGSALAAGLAQSGRSVAVVEAAPRSTDDRPGFDDRTLVVNAASLNILRNLGILTPELVACPIRRIDITRAGAPGHLRLRAEDYGRERFGAVIIARALGRAMLAALETADLVEQFCPARVQSIDTEANTVRVGLADGIRMEARLLVGADGTGSMVRRQAGIASERHDYGQSAMIFNVMADRVRAETAWERFTDSGPLALLPQPENRLGVVWIGSTAGVERLKDLADNELTRRLRGRFGPGLGSFFSPGRRITYPLVLQRTPRPIGHRVVLIGNAANTIHPVSAQGFNLGLRDAAGLIDTLAGASDPGDGELLESFADSRRNDQADTVRYTDTLARAFTNPSLAARAGSSLGLAAHAAFPALSRRLVHAAMGFREPVSSLAREPKQ